ncbi:hypothetical protein [Stenotrophomonas sp. S39]|uniref:hypothetical protein n=1 Tax=Stenotrophomonas sp. S39 TaxID=2767451 RepID=UPI00190D5850|nr:hypothetical protein [Stenotrophomonas sp. S39]MBK0053471.1 polysaccharide biosynthesis protein [Stenotrophomonas sp. S39]
MRPSSVLFVTSSGGHWVQASKLLAGLLDYEVDIATVDETAVSGVTYRRFYKIPDFNRDTPLKMILGVPAIVHCVLSSDATHVISTGAAPGLLALACARMVGKRTMWIDSIANTERLSVSGKIAKVIAHKTLTQWENVAEVTGASYEGRLL